MPTGFPFPDATSATHGGVTYWVHPQTYGERGDNPEGGEKGLTSSVNVTVAGDDAGDFLNAAFGYTTASGTTLSRELPLRHPLFATALYVKSATFVQGGPWRDAGGGWPEWDWITYRLEFDTRSFDLLGDSDGDTAAELRRYVTRRRHFQARERVISSYTLVTVEGGQEKPLNETGFVVDRAYDLVYVWHQVPEANFPRAAVEACAGLVNNSTFDTVTPKGYQHPAESLLFLGLANPERPYKLWDGASYLDIEYRFKRRVGCTWNQYPKPNGAVVDLRYAAAAGGTAGPGGKVFAAADFTTLFKPA